jgi:RimJ/RimL family protein N-acetyltransferase
MANVIFDYQPFLKSDILELRPLRTEDYDGLFAAAADPLIWELHPVKNRHEEETFKDFFRESLKSGGALVAIDAETRKIIGSSRYHGFDAEKSEIEIGWTFLARPYWGGTYNGQMKELMLDHAFQFVTNVIFLVGKENLRSQRAVEKIGGVRVGEQPDDGGYDSYKYRITASTFVRRA